MQIFNKINKNTNKNNIFRLAQAHHYREQAKAAGTGDYEAADLAADAEELAKLLAKQSEVLETQKRLRKSGVGDDADYLRALDLQAHEAARKIQMLQRGRLGRAEVKRQQLERDEAARKIQNIRKDAARRAQRSATRSLEVAGERRHRIKEKRAARAQREEEEKG